MATARGRMIRLLEDHPLAPPATIGDAHALHARIRRLRDASAYLHRGERVAYLATLRLDVYLAHWPDPPATDEEFTAFAADARGLIRHDLPRLLNLLAWAPTELPEQRTPRLGVPSLHTIA